MRNLNVDTPCVVWNEAKPCVDLHIRYFHDVGFCYPSGKKSYEMPSENKSLSVTAWSHIVPVDKFDFNNLSFDESDDYGMKVDKSKIYGKFV